MYEVLEKKQRMTREEIREKFDKKWVFLINVESEPGKLFSSAVPAVVADKMYEGKETGIYHALHNDPTTGCTMAISFLPDELSVFGFNEVACDE